MEASVVWRFRGCSQRQTTPQAAPNLGQPRPITVSLGLSAAYVEGSRPEASATSHSSTPRQRQIKRRAVSSFGQPRPASF